MDEKEQIAIERLSSGYFKQYQVNKEHGELSLEVLHELSTTFESSLRRFQDCCIFRFRLRIPNTFHGDPHKLLTNWFYMLVKEQPGKPPSKVSQKLIGNSKAEKEGVNMFWVEEISPKGAICFRVVLFFSSVPYQETMLPEQLREKFKGKVKSTWAKVLRCNLQGTSTLCTFPPGSLLTLKSGKSNYRYKAHECFYFLSTIAKKRLSPEPNKSSRTFGSNFSRVTKRREKASVTESNQQSSS